MKEKLRQLSTFVKECARVLKITKKPSNFEFKTIVKVSGIGILIISLRTRSFTPMSISRLWTRISQVS